MPESFEITDDEMWNNVTYFLKAVIPVAEKSGIRLALHPERYIIDDGHVDMFEAMKVNKEVGFDGPMKP